MKTLKNYIMNLGIVETLKSMRISWADLWRSEGLIGQITVWKPRSR